ncbi:MAG: hypothetical protein ACOYLG_02695 [Chitinophagaceae bacterium]|jgi:hypothetical protein
MKDSLSHYHLLCQDSIRDLDFFKAELQILRNRLTEVAGKNTGHDVLLQVEHFENKFHILGIHIDEMLHDVNLKNQSLLDEAAEKPNYIHIKMKETDEQLADLLHDTSSDFYATKKEFYQFLSKVF